MTPTEALLRYVLEHGRETPLDGRPEEVIGATLAQLDLGGAFYAAARRRGELDRWSPGFIDELRRVHAKNTTQALRLQHEIAEIRARLSVPVASLKGAALLESGVTRDPGSRTMLDLDILAHRRDRETVVRELCGLGFTMDGYGGPPKHLPAFRRGPTMLEVHEVAFWSRAGRRFGYEELVSTEVPLAFTVVHLVHHALVSSVVSPALVAKTLGDMAQLRTALADRPRVLRLAAELAADVGIAEGLEAFLAAAAAVSDASPAQQPAAALLLLCEPITEAEATRRYAMFHLEALTSGPGWYRRETLRSLLLPPRSAVEAVYGLRPGSPWAFPAYAVRPLHLGLRGLQALARSRRGK